MSFIVCDECGTKNELPSEAQPGGGAGDSYVYCRACANRIELSAQAPSAASAPAAEGGGSGDLLDELLSMPLAEPHHATREPEPPPPAARPSVDASGSEPTAAPPEPEARAEALAEPSLAATAEASATPLVETALEVERTALAAPPAAVTTVETEQAPEVAESAAVVAELDSPSVPVEVPIPTAGVVSVVAEPVSAEPVSAEPVPPVAAGIIAAPVIPIAPSAAAAEPAPIENRVVAPEPATQTAGPLDAEELSWELPSPAAPPASELQSSTVLAPEAAVAAPEPDAPSLVGEQVTAEASSEPSLASPEPAYTSPEPELAHVAIESGSANIRATLPFGPMLPLRETVPAIVTGSGAELDDVAKAEVSPPPAVEAEVSAASPALAESSHGDDGASRAAPQTDRVEPAPLPSAAAAVLSATKVAPPVLTRPFFEPNSSTASDAPTTHSWPPPELGRSKLRRYAPLAAALGAVAVAFFGGIQVGRMSPNTPPPTIAAAVPAPPAARAPTPEIAVPPTATSVPASAGTPEQAEPTTSIPGAKGSRTGLVALKPTAGFSAKVANAALAQLTGRARACKKGGASGTALAVVTFGTSGRVEDVTVSGARVAGTPAATCIASALSTARVPPFVGSAQTIKRAIKID